MSEVKAYDVVLMPSKEIIDLSIEVNKYLNKNNEPKIFLGGNNGVPHITLAFLGVGENDREEFIRKVGRLVEQFKKQKLSVSSFQTTWNGTSFNIDITDEVLKLRDDLFNLLKPFHKNISIRDFVKAEKEPLDIHVDWVNNYLKKENFWPHISLGRGEPFEVDFPIDFICERIAIYELGYHCTCQKLVKEFELK